MTTNDNRESMLQRAVVISLFTWRRAESSDRLDDDERMGWWGDSYPTLANDRIGSRLWLLRREKITRETLLRAEEYAREALQWLLDDGLAAAIDVQLQRVDNARVNLRVTLTYAAGSQLTVPFDDFWQVLNAV
ncbi:phage GP46 family protein [Cupriavidus oxalaticus]|uniref:Uncharacterized protein n=1 Tax=Cupriavidus oxalaticus TaxID=96344 RepID=A0A4P7LKR7_9BURK|nr:phage GP46 family protein [Cupriavidus oxalaticus]QBY56158.1 hypothetical protein E0W60_34445 [Cupriavidus oxalaticus]